MESIITFLSEELNNAMDSRLSVEGELRSLRLDIEFMEKAYDRLSSNKDDTGDVFMSSDSNEDFDRQEMRTLKSKKEELSTLITEKEKEYTDLQKRCEQLTNLLNICGKTDDETIEYMSDEDMGDTLYYSDNERREVACELYDTVLSNLMSVVKKNDFVKRILLTDTHRATLELDNISSIVNESVTRLEKIIDNISFIQSEQVILADELEKLSVKLKMLYRDVNITVECDDLSSLQYNTGEISNLINIIYIISDYVLTFSQCKDYSIILEADEGILNIMIEDNGTEYELKNFASAGSLMYDSWLQLMNRITVIKGSLTVKRRKKGNMITLTIPRNDND